MPADPRHLVDRASRGDAGALAELLARYAPELERFMRNRAGPRMRAKESGADLAQSVCREVLEHLADGRFEYRGEAAFRQWLFEAALLKLEGKRRFWGADRRDLGREARPPADSGLSLEDRFLARIASPSQQVMAAEKLDRARAAFLALSDEQREIIRLAQIENLPHREIAVSLGISESHSRVLLSRALARLATLLAKN